MSVLRRQSFAPSPQQQSETSQLMMALMFLMQLGCCDGTDITKCEDLVPDPKSVQSMVMTAMSLMCKTMLFISFVWCMMTPRRCKDVGTPSPKAVTIAVEPQTSALICRGRDVRRTRSDCYGFSDAFSRSSRPKDPANSA